MFGFGFFITPQEKVMTNWFNIILGILLIPAFPIEYHFYHKAGCLTPFLFEPVCGEGAMVVLACYGLTSLFGIYFLISGLKKRNSKNKII